MASKLYEERPIVGEIFKILAVDEHEGTEFVIAVEGKEYPIFGVMHHPETQNIRIFGDMSNDKALAGKVNNETTDALNFYFSLFLHEEAKKNLDTHKFSDPEFGKRMSFKNVPVGFTTMYGSSMLSYGFHD